MKGLSLVTLSLIGLLVSTSAAATDFSAKGFYAGGSLGVNSEAINFGVYGGYDFDHLFGFDNLFGLEGTLFRTTNMGNDLVDIHATVITVAPKISYAFTDKVSGFFKLGPSLSFISDDFTYTADESVTNAGIMFGFGVNIAIIDRLNARLMYENISSDLGGDLDSFTAGIHYKF